ncbi:MAG: hypothetical protein OEQ12_01080 [Nitrosopumilus sp.]|nr:hypothetical protein [Nitrosopumilus sp.]
MINHKFLVTSILSIIVIFSSSSLIFAHPHSGQTLIDGHTHQPQTEYIPLNGIIGIEKTFLIFHTSEENSLPWGYVEGKIANHVAAYPVIIQIFKDDEAVHFAQTDVNEEGNYEYKFRVLNVESENTTKIFDGNYHVTIFKVVYLKQNNLI